MTSTPLRWTRTRTSRYSATAGGFRYVAQLMDGDWVLSITRTQMVVDVEVCDPNSRPDYAFPETYREAKLIAQEHADRSDLPAADRFRIANAAAYDKIIAQIKES